MMYDEHVARRITAHGRVTLSSIILKFMGSQKKEVRFLSVGDVLSGSKAKVISKSTAGLKTPSGKVEIGIEYPNGVKKTQTWGKYTVVSVDVADALEVQNTDATVGVTTIPFERSLESGL